jgi:hypothetical protein
MPNLPEMMVIGKIVKDDDGVMFLASMDFRSLPTGEQWVALRAAHRSIDRILSKLSDRLVEENQRMAAHNGK